MAILGTIWERKIYERLLKIFPSDRQKCHHSPERRYRLLSNSDNFMSTFTWLDFNLRFFLSIVSKTIQDSKKWKTKYIWIRFVQFFYPLLEKWERHFSFSRDVLKSLATNFSFSDTRDSHFLTIVFRVYSSLSRDLSKPPLYRTRLKKCKFNR